VTDVKEHNNKGPSVAIPTALKKAIESNEGIDGVQATVVPVLKNTLIIMNIKWEVDENRKGKENDSATNQGHDWLTMEENNRAACVTCISGTEIFLTKGNATFKPFLMTTPNCSSKLSILCLLMTFFVPIKLRLLTYFGQYEQHGIISRHLICSQVLIWSDVFASSLCYLSCLGRKKILRKTGKQRTNRNVSFNQTTKLVVLCESVNPRSWVIR